MWRYQSRDSLKEYQRELKSSLQQVFGIEEVEVEWSSMRDEFGLDLYSPRLDVAVGPFATQERLGFEYDRMLEQDKASIFIQELVRFNRENIQQWTDGFVEPIDFEGLKYLNYNARCFLAIEIENEVSRKHLMGGAINASALGRIGVVIPWSQEKLRAFVKLVRYLQYLKNAEKNTFDTSNLLIVTREQMLSSIESVSNAAASSREI